MDKRIEYVSIIYFLDSIMLSDFLKLKSLLLDMSDTPISSILPNFDKLSFMSGAFLAFSEAVGFGVKQLALSSLYNHDELEIMLKVIEYGSQRYGTVYLAEPALLKSKLFRRDIAEGKTVVLIANNQKVLDRYAELKSLKAESNSKGEPDDLELEIARRFGKLLSYDDKSIEGLIAKYG